MLRSINPATGEVVKTYESHSHEGVVKIINSVDKIGHHWRSTSFMFRSQLMQNLASLLKTQKEELAMLMALEMGKVKREGIAEVEKCAWVCEYYATNAEAFLENEPIATEATKSYV